MSVILNEFHYKSVSSKRFLFFSQCRERVYEDLMFRDRSLMEVALDKILYQINEGKQNTY